MVKFNQIMVKFINKFYLSLFMSREKVYKAFFESNNEDLYYNQLKELTKLSYSSLQNVLKKLELSKEIIKTKTKSNTYYKLSYLKPLEFAKISIELFNSLNCDVRVPLKEFIKQVPISIHSIVLFGSASIKKEKTNSDIDLLIILESFEDKVLQKHYEKEIKAKFKKINISSIYPFSIAYTNIKEFKEQNDFLIKEVINTGFPLMNQQKYYEGLL